MSAKLTLPGPRPAGPQGERPAREKSPHDRPPMNRDHNRDQTRGQARVPSVPAGAVWLYGTHAVAAALPRQSRSAAPAS